MLYKTGIIGCGGIAGYDRREYCHAEAYQRHPNTELAAVYDIDGKKEKEFAAQWNIPQEKLEDLDIVSICTPDETHIDCLELCLALPNIKAVWCEKPICRDYDEALDIARKYAEAGKTLCVNYQRRWAPKFHIPKKEIKKISIGYTGGLWRNGCHGVDLILYLLGSYDTGIVQLNELDCSEFCFDVKIVTKIGTIGAHNEMYDLYPVLDNIVSSIGYNDGLLSNGFTAAETTKVCQILERKNGKLLGMQSGCGKS